MSVSDFREAVAARGPLSKSAREELIRNTWEPSRRQWRFDIPHQGKITYLAARMDSEWCIRSLGHGVLS